MKSCHLDRTGINCKASVQPWITPLTGNVAGLVAALMYRGIRLVQVPTTFLAMSDSVLSLKQTVNAGCGKNLLGTFHKPEFVWVDLGYLDTLPVAKVRAFEEGLLSLLRGKNLDILNTIRDSRDLSDDTAAKLKTAVEGYARTFT